MSHIFISYKRVDKEKVFKIKDQIESALGEKCWIDIDGIESDAQFKNVIIAAINKAEIVLFMYSKEHAKITSFESDWTVRELNFAARKKKRIVFVNIDRSPLIDIFEFDFGTKQQIDGTSKRDLEKLVEDMKKWLPALNVEKTEVVTEEKSQPKVPEAVKESRGKYHVIQKYWTWFVFALHSIATFYTVLVAFVYPLLWLSVAFALLGTYGSWMSSKQKSRALLTMCVGDLLTTVPLLFISNAILCLYLAAFIAFCLTFNWLVLHVNLNTSKPQ